MTALVRMLAGFLFLTVIYLGSNWAMMTLHLPFPGSLAGLLVCTGLIWAKVIPLDWVEGAADGLLGHLPLLYLPFVASIGQYWPLFKQSGIGLVGIVMVATGLVVVVTGFTAQRLGREKEEPHVDLAR